MYWQIWQEKFPVPFLQLAEALELQSLLEESSQKLALWVLVLLPELELGSELEPLLVLWPVASLHEIQLSAWAVRPVQAPWGQ